MRTRRIGQLEVSATGLGCNNFGMRCDEEQTAAVVAAALDAGVTFFDTADVYGGQGRSEELLGRCLEGRRDEVVIATKFGAPMGGNGDRQGASARWIATAVEDSLRRLGTDRIDLYQLHFPDQETPIDETLGALTELVQQGKVLEIGCSNFSSAQIEGADAAAGGKGTRFVSVQNEYSLLNRRPEKNVLPACEARGLAFLPYFPLAHGLLTGKYTRGEAPPDGTRLAAMPEERREQVMTEDRLEVVERLAAFAAERGHTVAELAFAWLLAHPPVASVIAGATRPEQVRANAAASEWELSTADLGEVDRLLG